MLGRRYSDVTLLPETELALRLQDDVPEVSEHCPPPSVLSALAFSLLLYVKEFSSVRGGPWESTSSLNSRRPLGRL